jgi:hypothetical protein
MPGGYGWPHPKTPASRLLRGVAAGDACAMLFHEHTEGLDLTAAELRGYLFELETERALAVDAGVAEIDAYMADLEEELELSRRLYVTAGVTEIATLRAELSGPQSG